MGPPGFSSSGWVTVHGGRFSKKPAASEYQDGALRILKHGFFGKQESRRRVPRLRYYSAYSVTVFVKLCSCFIHL